MLIVCGFAFLNGNPAILFHPTDYQGNICGYTSSVASLPYGVYFNLLDCFTGAPTIPPSCSGTPLVCVAACPTSTVGAGIDMSVSQAVCKYGISVTSTGDIVSNAVDGNCAPYLIESTSIFGRCIPDLAQFAYVLYDLGSGTQNVTYNDILTPLSQLIAVFNAQEFASKVLTDLEHGWVYLLAGAGVTIVLCFVWMVLLEYFCTVLVWLTVVGAIALSGAGAVYMFFEWQNQPTSGTENVPIIGTLDTQLYQKYTYLALAIILAAVCVILLLVVIFLFNRLRLAIEIIRVAAK